jgi:hypothetical protein
MVRRSSHDPRAPRISRTLTGYLWASRAAVFRAASAIALLRSLAVAPCPWLFQRMIDVSRAGPR